MRNFTIALLLTFFVTMPLQIQAEDRVRGRLDSVFLAGKHIEVDGKIYIVNTEMTKVIYNGQSVGEESLLPGDLVELILASSENGTDIPRLIAILLLRGSKPELDS
jgi:hypothetical protein